MCIPETCFCSSRLNQLFLVPYISNFSRVVDKCTKVVGVLEKFLSLDKQKWLWETERDRNSFCIWSSLKCLYKTNLRNFTDKNWQAIEKGVGSFTRQGWVFAKFHFLERKDHASWHVARDLRGRPSRDPLRNAESRDLLRIMEPHLSVNKTLGLYVGTLTYEELCRRKQRPWRCNLHIKKFTHNECFSFFLDNSDVQQNLRVSYIPVRDKWGSDAGGV